MSKLVLPIFCVTQGKVGTFIFDCDYSEKQFYSSYVYHDFVNIINKLDIDTLTFGSNHIVDLYSTYNNLINVIISYLDYPLFMSD